MKWNKTKIIAFEGIDGSGKTLQSEMLCNKLMKEGYSVSYRSFPQYNSFFGKEIGKMLNNGEAGSLNSKSMALWYALDRKQSFDEKNCIDGMSDFLIINRYTLSNAVYQSVRGKDDTIFEWCMNLEHNKFNLPCTDIFYILDAELEFTQNNVDKKGEREYTKGKDIYEADVQFLQDVKNKYIELSKNCIWTTDIELIQSMSEPTIMLCPDEISTMIWNNIKSKFYI